MRAACSGSARKRTFLPQRLTWSLSGSGKQTLTNWSTAAEFSDRHASANPPVRSLRPVRAGAERTRPSNRSGGAGSRVLRDCTSVRLAREDAALDAERVEHAGDVVDQRFHADQRGIDRRLSRAAVVIRDAAPSSRAQLRNRFLPDLPASPVQPPTATSVRGPSPKTRACSRTPLTSRNIADIFYRMGE